MAADFLAACKTGLNIAQSTTALDSLLNQKIMAVKGYLSGAGVSAAVMESDLAIGVIVLGVTDLWELTGGQAKLSLMFTTLASQLAYQSYANINAFRVNYDGNGSTSGNVPIDNNVYQQSNTAGVLDNIGALVKTGYNFSGWNTAADGSGVDYAGGGTLAIGSASIKLYAKWVGA
jgi:hypothetical protein